MSAKTTELPESVGRDLAPKLRRNCPMESGALARKEKCGDMAPQRAKDDESDATAVGPGERLLYSCWSANESADTMREFPA